MPTPIHDKPAWSRKPRSAYTYRANKQSPKTGQGKLRRATLRAAKAT